MVCAPRDGPHPYGALPHGARPAGGADAAAGAEVAYDEYLRRRESGEEVEFAAFCSEHPGLSDALQILHSLKAAPASDGSATVSGSSLFGTGEPEDAPDDAQRTVRFCIRCGTEIGRSPYCTHPGCEGIPNFYRAVPPPAVAEELPHGAGGASHAGAPRQTLSLSPRAEATLRRVDAAREEHDLPAGGIELGAGASAGIVVDAPEVSSRHARLRWGSTRAGERVLVLEDLQSTNGTYLNGRRVRRARVRSGDRLRLGSVEFELTLDGRRDGR